MINNILLEQLLRQTDCSKRVFRVLSISRILRKWPRSTPDSNKNMHDKMRCTTGQ